MSRFLIALFAALAVAAGTNCAAKGLGDPCEPESCPPKLDEEGNPTGECDWQAEEVYLEHFSLQCRSRVCMVFRPDADWKPYCTRRCGPGAAVHGCGESYTCMEVVTGATAGAGCYCEVNTSPSSPDADRIAACK
jgi:hypothetical protein